MRIVSSCTPDRHCHSLNLGYTFLCYPGVLTKAIKEHTTDKNVKPRDANGNPHADFSILPSLS